MPGLVDAHCHVGLERQGAVSDERAEEQAITDRDAGALLLRDAGSPADTRWMDSRDDLPKIIRAGRHIARPKRYLRNYGAEVEPDELITEVERQAARGDGWVKLVGDWIDRDVGDLAPLWPADLAKAAIARAHELGCRVTAHVFGEQAVAELVAAGIDGIEHGTGMDDATISLMAERQVALVPTMIQLDNFEAYAQAGEEKYPVYASHIRALYAAASSGSQRPWMRVSRSTPVLMRAGFFRMAWSATKLRHWRSSVRPSTPWAPAPGERGNGSATRRRSTEGAPADLVVFDADPRVDLERTEGATLS